MIAIFKHLMIAVVSAAIAITSWEVLNRSNSTLQLEAGTNREELEMINQRLGKIEKSLADLLTKSANISSISQAQTPSKQEGQDSSKSIQKSNAKKQEELAIAIKERELLLSRHETMLDQALQDFDKAQILYEEGKIPIEKLEALKRHLEGLEFAVEHTKLESNKRILELQQ